MAEQPPNDQRIRQIVREEIQASETEPRPKEGVAHADEFALETKPLRK